MQLINRLESDYSIYQFKIFRVIFGLYLLQHFILLIPYAEEMFSNNGMLPDPTILPTYKVFPNILSLFDSPGFATTWLILLSLLSIAFIQGKFRRVASIILWYGWASLLNRNIFIANPGIPYIGWLLLACAFIPADKKAKEFKLSGYLFYGGFFLMAIGYTISGIHKLGAPSWQDGTALYHVFNLPTARDSFLRDFAMMLPIGWFKVLTWSSLSLELLALPLCLFHRGRLIFTIAIIGMHLGILLFVSIADLTCGLLMLHLFLIDPTWFPKRKIKEGEEKPIVFFDGVCGLCDGFVNFLFTEDRSNNYLVATLQGETAKDKKVQSADTELSTIKLYDQGKIYTHSEAVLKIVSGWGGIWWLARIFLIIPSFIRDNVYNFIAKNRYRWFGKNDACRLPTPEERAKFLD